MAAMQSVIGDYRIVARIDEGGMGAVFRAQHATLGHDVAIKLLPTTLATDPNAQQWFRRGAASSAALQHPNILPVYHYGEHDGAPYLVMPYITGGTLKDRLLRGSLSFAEIVRVMEQLTAALDFAHSQGVVHRDVKPANLLLDERGTLYLADFGIAKALESATKFTRTGTTIGTPEYMAPEQARGHADHRSDLYAAGIILYQLLTGQVPFTGDSAVEILMQHIQDPLPLAPVRAVRPALPGAIEPVVARALAKRPEERYQRGADLVADLSAALAGATERPYAMLPDNQPTVIAPRTPTPQPFDQRSVLTPTPAPYAVPMAAAPMPTPAPNRPDRRKPLVIGLSVALAAVLLLSSVVGVGAWVIIRPTPTPNTQGLAIVDPTATALPATATRQLPATSTPAPTNTPRPTNTPTTQPPTKTPTPPPPTATATVVTTGPTPRGNRPAGWKTYIGIADAPFALYYPGDWQVDDAKLASDGVVRFVAPDKVTSLLVQFMGKIDPASANVDVLRDQAKQSIVNYCNRESCALSNEVTGTEKFDGILFGVYKHTITYSDKSASRHHRSYGVVYGDGQPYGWFYNAVSAPSTWASYETTWELMLNSVDFTAPR